MIAAIVVLPDLLAAFTTMRLLDERMISDCLGCGIGNLTNNSLFDLVALTFISCRHPHTLHGW